MNETERARAWAKVVGPIKALAAAMMVSVLVATYSALAATDVASVSARSSPRAGMAPAVAETAGRRPARLAHRRRPLRLEAEDEAWRSCRGRQAARGAPTRPLLGARRCSCKHRACERRGGRVPGPRGPRQVGCPGPGGGPWKVRRHGPAAGARSAAAGAAPCGAHQRAPLHVGGMMSEMDFSGLRRVEEKGKSRKAQMDT